LINHILLICFTIFVYEFFKFSELKNIIKSNLKILKKIINLFYLKNTTDLEKEKKILIYAKSLFTTSLKILLVIFIILIITMFLNYLSRSFLDLILSFIGLIEVSLIFIIYHQIRKKVNAKL
tara:strand:- start:816 stop:1181 length:366 start_codon:yes stop_codon:yes gene_type:complete